MCKDTPLEDIPMPDNSWFDNVEADEEMFQSDEESHSDPADSLACSVLFYKGCSVDNIVTKMQYYNDIFLTDIHLTSEVHKMYNVQPDTSLCCVDCKDNPFVYVSSSDAHLLYHFEVFKDELNLDAQYTTNQFFCYYCRRFLYDTTDVKEEFCEDCIQMHNEYFVTNEVNTLISIM